MSLTAEARMRAQTALVVLEHCQELGLDDDACVTAAKLALRPVAWKTTPWKELEHQSLERRKNPTPTEGEA